MASPSFEHYAHAGKHVRLVIDANDPNPGEVAKDGFGLALRRKSGDGLSRLDPQAKARTGTKRRVELDWMIQNPANAFDNRQTEPEAASTRRARIEAPELLKNFPVLVFGNAKPGIGHLDGDGSAAAPDPDQNAARRRIFDGVGDEILQNPSKQFAIAAHPSG